MNTENTFLVKIKYRQNSSWQGSVQWVEAGKTQNFKSCLELMRLMDMAVTSSDERAENKLPDDGEGQNSEK
ncbi:MAG: hypothetical protein FWG34_03035 [Oscillospiraceae bacterium]|nr:hypothetical protein [Oscillospiraceae bacterium]